jgi:hypothetical protein
MDVAAFLRGNADIQRCPHDVITANGARRRDIEATLVERTKSAVQLFALVNEQVKKDATVRRGQSTMYLLRKHSGAWVLSSQELKDGQKREARNICTNDTAVVDLVKEIFKGYEFHVESSELRLTTLPTYGYHTLTVSWRVSTADDDLSAAWAKAMDIIKAQAARVLQEQQPAAGKLAVQEEEAENKFFD